MLPLALLAVTAQKRVWTRVLEITGVTACEVRPLPIDSAADAPLPRKSTKRRKKAELASCKTLENEQAELFWAVVATYM